jgi:hypothetical protein
MAENKDDKWGHAARLVREFGLGGVLIVGGFVIVGLAIFKGPDFADEHTQMRVLMGGAVAGLAAAVLGGVLMWRKPHAAVPVEPSQRPIDVFIAAPMAGFGADDAGRKVAVEIVQTAQAALLRLGLPNVHAPPLSRPVTDTYESPGTGFNVEAAALSQVKRYLLILPSAMPPGTSVLLTVGMAIALKLPCLVLADKTLTVPFLLEGAAQSKAVNLRLCRYQDAKELAKLIGNDGVKLWDAEAA